MFSNVADLHAGIAAADSVQQSRDEALISLPCVASAIPAFKFISLRSDSHRMLPAPTSNVPANQWQFVSMLARYLSECR